MSPQAPENTRLGIWKATTFHDETVRSFVPPPLPPEPPVNLGGLQVLLEQANQSLGRLDGLAVVLPGLDLFLYAYVRKEALLSAQIEGTQSSLSDLLLFEVNEAPGVPLDDVQEVSCYVAAMNYGLERLRAGFPLSLRLIREIHDVLLRTGRGGDKQPGEFRTTQNWIGGTRPGNAFYVPPPPELVMECMGKLELFLHEERSDLPLLIKAALVHVQFESIHPFLDGNGRLGRLLITFLLCAGGALREPMLYLSLYLKKNRPAYYDLLTRVRSHGAWEEWLEFFLTGVKETSEQAVGAVRRILALLDADRKKVDTVGRAAASVLRVFQLAQARPILTVSEVVKQLEVSFPTASSAIEQLQKLGILHEISGRQRHRIYAYRAYLAILSEGTEPIPLRA